MLARTIVAAPAFAVDGKNLGIARGQPGWRRTGWGTEHNRHPRIGQGGNGAVNPVPVPFILRRLYARPGEFTNPGVGQTHVSHLVCVYGPTVFGPLFGVIADAEGKVGK